MHLLGTGVPQHSHDLPGRIAADDRIVHDHEPLAFDYVRQRVELHSQATVAELLTRLDEGAGDVSVLDQAVVLRDARCAREPLCGCVAGIGDGDHEICFDRGLLRQDLSHPASNRLKRATFQLRVRAREVDVLEDTKRTPLGVNRLA